MNVTVFIERSIARGSSSCFTELTRAEQIPFLISEAEVYCDKDGIEALVRRYGAESLPAFSSAFQAAGASSIAGAHDALAGEPASEEFLSLANDLITHRVGYSWESICAAVENEI